MIYIVIPKEYSERFIDYFLEKKISSRKIESDLLEVDFDDYKQFLKIINQDYLCRYVSRVFFVSKKIGHLDQLKEITQNIRVQVYPKKEEETILQMLENNNVKLSPTEFESILYIVNLNNCYYYELLDKDYFYRKISEKQVARAYYKIKQIVCEKEIDVKNKTVLDIGAAPGGWSQYLKEYASQIIAVDPAELQISKENIVHFKNKLEDVIDQINSYEYDIIICDINDEFYKVIKNIFKLNYKGKQLIMTLKFSRKSIKLIEKEIEEIKEYMLQYSKNVEILWLFANTRFERTLYCLLD